MYNPGSCRLLSPTSTPIAVAIGSKFACPYVAFGMQLSRIVRSLAAVINILDPDAIVLGGGLSCLNTALSIGLASDLLHLSFDGVGSDAGFFSEFPHAPSDGGAGHPKLNRPDGERNVR